MRKERRTRQKKRRLRLFRAVVFCLLEAGRSCAHWSFAFLPFVPREVRGSGCHDDPVLALASRTSRSRNHNTNIKREREQRSPQRKPIRSPKKKKKTNLEKHSLTVPRRLRVGHRRPLGRPRDLRPLPRGRGHPRALGHARRPGVPDARAAGKVRGQHGPALGRGVVQAAERHPAAGGAQLPGQPVADPRAVGERERGEEGGTAARGLAFLCGGTPPLVFVWGDAPPCFCARAAGTKRESERVLVFALHPP